MLLLKTLKYHNFFMIKALHNSLRKTYFTHFKELWPTLVRKTSHLGGHHRSVDSFARLQSFHPAALSSNPKHNNLVSNWILNVSFIVFWKNKNKEKEAGLVHKKTPHKIEPFCKSLRYAKKLSTSGQYCRLEVCFKFGPDPWFTVYG